MSDQGEERELAHAITRFTEAADRISSGRPSGNWNSIQVTGMGSFWNGMAIGISVGVAVVGAGWVAWALGDIRDQQRQQDAFIQAAYQYAPKWRDEYHKIEQEFSDVQRSDPYPDRSPAAPAAAPGR